MGSSLVVCFRAREEKMVISSRRFSVLLVAPTPPTWEVPFLSRRRGAHLELLPCMEYGQNNITLQRTLGRAA